MMEPLSYLFLADTPLQTINCVSIALGGVQGERAERHDLVIYGQFSNAQQMYEFALASGAFDNVHLYQGVSSYGRWGQRRALLDVFFGRHCLDEIPEFIGSTEYAAMLFSFPTAVSYDLFSVVRANNPKADVYFYEDGTGTYTGSIFRGLIYPGEAPAGIANRPLVNVAKKVLKRVSSAYRPYPVKRLYVKCPALLQSDYGLDVVEFKLNRGALAYEGLAPSELSERLASVDLLYLEPPEADNCFDANLELERYICESGFGLGVRKHPRTLRSCPGDMAVADCTGGLWESLCGAVDEDRCVLVGPASSAMVSPAVEYGLMPKIIFLDHMEGIRKDVAQADLVVEMVRAVYRGREELVFTPKTKGELLDSLLKAGLVPNKTDDGFRGCDDR